MSEKHPPRAGAVRVINYVGGTSDDGSPLYNHRIEQYYDGEWAEISIYYERSNGELLEFVRSKENHK